MSVVLVCPACGHAHTLHRPPAPAECDRCHAAFPPAAARAAGDALAASIAPRPLLLTLGMGFTAFWAAVGLLVLLVSALGNGTYTIDEQPVTRREYFSHPGTLALFGLVPFAAALAWAMWRERSWTRHVMLGGWLASAVLMLLPRSSAGC